MFACDVFFAPADQAVTWSERTWQGPTSGHPAQPATVVWLGGANTHLFRSCQVLPDEQSLSLEPLDQRTVTWRPLMEFRSMAADWMGEKKHELYSTCSLWVIQWCYSYCMTNLMGLEPG